MGRGIWIKNGRVMDPARGIDRTENVLIRDGRIVPFSPDEAGKAAEAIDAAGCLVLPGLIDFHAHLAHRMTDTGVNPDLMALPNGITAAVDAGSVGSAGADAFVRNIIGGCETTIRLFVNVSAVGVATEQYPENPDPARFDEDAILAICGKYPDHILGLKLRLGKGFSPGLGLKPLIRAKEIARRAGRPLCVHLTNSEFPYADLLDRLEGGDILCHCFQGMGEHNILDASGGIGGAARRARARGVVFDAAVGRINYDLAVARKALADGFPPDVLSTDVVATSLYQRKLFHLLYVMSLFLALGLPLMEVVRACTAAPAALMRLGGRIGTLAPGAEGDAAIFRLRQGPVEFRDQYGHSAAGNLLLAPLATVKAGRTVYKRIDFEF
jgi:dihydroorotase